MTAITQKIPRGYTRTAYLRTKLMARKSRALRWLWGIAVYGLLALWAFSLMQSLTTIIGVIVAVVIIHILSEIDFLIIDAPTLTWLCLVWLIMSVCAILDLIIHRNHLTHKKNRIAIIVLIVNAIIAPLLWLIF